MNAHFVTLLVGSLLSINASATILSATNSTRGFVDASDYHAFPPPPPDVYCPGNYRPCFIDRIVTLGSGLVEHIDLTVTLSWFLSEGSLHLTHGGVQVPLLSGLSSNSYIIGIFETITFDDFASEILSSPVISGLYRPAEALSAFNGMNAAGDWILTIGDWDGGDPTVFRSFTLNATVPEPSTLTLLALAIAGFGFMPFYPSKQTLLNGWIRRPLR